MKKIIQSSFYFAWALFISTQMNAQQIAPTDPCYSTARIATIDSLKNYFISQQYTFVQGQTFPMESKYEKPIMMPLQAGIAYAFCFIGEPDAKLNELRVYDWQEKQIFYKKLLWGEVDGNVISFPIIPEGSQYYMIKPLQIHKSKKALCGTLLMFKLPGKIVR